MGSHTWLFCFLTAFWAAVVTGNTETYVVRVSQGIQNLHLTGVKDGSHWKFQGHATSCLADLVDGTPLVSCNLDSLFNGVSLQRGLACILSGRTPVVNVSYGGAVFEVHPAGQPLTLPLQPSSEVCPSVIQWAKFQTTATLTPPPNIGFLGQGIDELKFNPTQEILRTYPIINLTYLTGATTADLRYSVPDATDILFGTTCTAESSTTEIAGESTLKKSFDADFKVSSTFSSYAFSLSAAYSTMSENHFKYADVAARMTARCLIYDAKFRAQTLPLDAVFKNRFLTMDSLAAAKTFVADFGTAFISQANFGAMFSEVSIFSSLSRQTYEQNKVSLEASASSSLSTSMGGSATVSSTEQERFNSLRKAKLAWYAGTLPTAGLNSWAPEIIHHVPVKFTLTSLRSLLTSTYFPTLTAAQLSAKLAWFDDATASYRNTGRNMSAVVDPAALVVTKLTTYGTRTFTMTCPATAPWLLSAGYSVRQSGSFEAFLGFRPISSTAAQFYHYFGMDASIQCTNINMGMIPVSVSSRYSFTATCPTGYKVAGCHIYPNQGSDYEAFRSAYPDAAGTMCNCYDYFGATCVASCIPATRLAGYQIMPVRNNPARTITASCPINTYVLGCGFQKVTRTQERLPVVMVADGAQACVCYDYYGVDCFAMCGSPVR